MILLLSIITLILIIFTTVLVMKLNKANRIIFQKQKIISEQKEKVDDFNVKITSLEALAKKHTEFKSEFLASVGHELRTPLNAIIGYAKLMYNNSSTTSQSKYLDNIIQSSDNLVIIISELLDFSKIEAGKMLIDKAPFNPINVISQTISTLKVCAEEKSNPLEIHIDAEMPQYVMGDQKHLSHILINVINNAIKFSPINKAISIEAHCTKEEQNCILTFIINDKGIGIPESKFESIFESFNQVKSDKNKKYNGTGLGLAIVKRLIDLQNGKISLKSKINEGTTFTIEIPYEIASINNKITDKKIKTKNIDKVENKKVNILLAEDNDINQELAKDTVLSWGDQFTIDIADNGKIAIEMLKNKTYDLVLMDIQMPEMDGHEATIYIRQEMDTPLNNIPIIGMTAHALQSEKDIAIKNGMNDYVIKPFNPNTLKEVILNYV